MERYLHVDNINELINELTSILRDIKLNSVFLEKNFFELITPQKNIFSFLYKGNKIIKEIDELGGVLTGSRALKMYHIKGIPLISRELDDWDFIIEEPEFYKFCADHSLKDLNYDNKTVGINFKTGIFTGRNYGNKNYILKHQIDLICNKLPNYIQCGKYKVASLESIINYKLQLIKNRMAPVNGLVQVCKNLTDCIEIIIKLKAYH